MRPPPTTAEAQPVSVMHCTVLLKTSPLYPAVVDTEHIGFNGKRVSMGSRGAAGGVAVQSTYASVNYVNFVVTMYYQE